MQRIVKFLLAVVACMALSAPVEANPTGKWVLTSFNGSAPSGFQSVKIIKKDGSFTVLWSYDDFKTYVVMNQGTWQEELPGVVVENPQLVKNGPNALNYKRVGDKLLVEYTYKNQQTHRIIKEEYVKYETFMKQKQK